VIKVKKTVAALLTAFALLVVPSVTNAATQMEAEPNNVRSSANLMTSQTIQGTMSSMYDLDYFKFVNEDANAKSVTFTLTNIPTHLDYNIYIYDGAGKQVAEGVNKWGLDEKVELPVAPGTTYYVMVGTVTGCSLVDYYTLGYSLNY
jgi:hypothetical protein